MTFAPAMNTVLADRFLVEREVGRGGVGIVYKAHDQITGAEVARRIRRNIGGDTALVRIGIEQVGTDDDAHAHGGGVIGTNERVVDANRIG